MDGNQNQEKKVDVQGGGFLEGDVHQAIHTRGFAPDFFFNFQEATTTTAFLRIIWTYLGLSPAARRIVPTRGSLADARRDGEQHARERTFPAFFFFFCDFSRGKWAREKGTAKSSSICMQKLRYFTECLRGRTPGEGHLFPFCLDLFSLSFLEHRVRCSFVSAGEGGRGGGREGEQGAACECIHYRETLLFPPSLLRLPWLPLSTLVPGSHGAWDNIEDGESLGTPLAKVMVRLV